MAAERALGLVVRTFDWSETSRIAVIWTREFGKVRVLAKGGRRLKSDFEIALDLLTVCSMVFLRKASGGLEILTEAQVVERFPKLREQLPALYAGYYVAELLSEWTEEYDPHPVLFDEAVAALRDFGAEGVSTANRLASFELRLLNELGYRPVLDVCASCRQPWPDGQMSTAFAPAVGGVVCSQCQHGQRDRWPISGAARQRLRELADAGDEWRRPTVPAVRTEIRRTLGQYIAYLMGRRPRLLAYLTTLS